jgi:hypothetical protein
VAAALNRVVGAWPGVRITPMFGRFGYFVGDTLFGCYPIRPKSHDLWVRLAAGDQARALGSAGVRPHRRFAGRGWIECDVVEPGAVPGALRWLRRAYEYARRRPEAGTPSGEAPRAPAPPPPGRPPPPAFHAARDAGSQR